MAAWTFCWARGLEASVNVFLVRPAASELIPQPILNCRQHESVRMALRLNKPVSLKICSVITPASGKHRLADQPDAHHEAKRVADELHSKLFGRPCRIAPHAVVARTIALPISHSAVNLCSYLPTRMRSVKSAMPYRCQQSKSW